MIQINGLGRMYRACMSYGSSGASGGNEWLSWTWTCTTGRADSYQCRTAPESPCSESCPVSLLLVLFMLVLSCKAFCRVLVEQSLWNRYLATGIISNELYQVQGRECGFVFSFPFFLCVCVFWCFLFCFLFFCFFVVFLFFFSVCVYVFLFFNCVAPVGG